MKQITLKVNSNEEIWSIIDKTLPHVFIHKLIPTETLAWWKTDLKTENGIILKNLSVRRMQMDVQTDLKELKTIIELNTRQLRFYQSSKPIPDTLDIGSLPKASRAKILIQNGFKHFFFIDHEFLTIGSFDVEFLNTIEFNPLFSNRIQKLR